MKMYNFGCPFHQQEKIVKGRFEKIDFLKNFCFVDTKNPVDSLSTGLLFW